MPARHRKAMAMAVKVNIDFDPYFLSIVNVLD